jgi:4-alpha-glucanotransferase
MKLAKSHKEVGVFLPIFSLPDDYGIGTIGKGARAFVDFLQAGGFHYWVMLPIVPTSYLDSPYSSFSSKALNPYFIDLADLIEQGILTKRDTTPVDWGSDPSKVDYGKIYQNRMRVLRKGFKRFKKYDNDYLRGYTHFLRENTFLDYACFMALKSINHDKPWYEFNPPYNNYSREQFRQIKKENKFDVEFQIWTQYIFLRQWEKLKTYAHERGVYLVGDVPAFLSYDSEDVYVHRHNFLLDEENKMTEVVGYPKNKPYPDGQFWGVPAYNNAYLKSHDYHFIQKRLDFNMNLFDMVKISSFESTLRYYSLPVGCTDIEKGTWKESFGLDGYDHLHYDPDRIVAEDIEVEDKRVHQFIEDRKFADIIVMEYAIKFGKESIYDPKEINYNCLSYSSTHDSLPLVGYFDELSLEETKKISAKINQSCYYFGVEESDGSPIDNARAVLEINLACNSRIAVQAMTDILYQGSEARINVPGSLGGNWSYRILKTDLSKELAKRLRKQNEFFNRC